MSEVDVAVKKEMDRMNDSFRTIIYRLQREVAPCGVEMILEDNDSTTTQEHPLTHPLVFHYAVWSKDHKKVEYALSFLSEYCKELKINGQYEKHQEGAGNNPAEIANICTYHIIVRAMKMKSQYPHVQTLACKVIEDSLFCSSMEKRIAALESGVLNAVLEAMEYFPFNLSVQRNACGALLFLVWDCRAIAQSFIGSNGHHATVTALRNFPNDVMLQRSACWLLCNISEMKGFEQSLVDADALSVLGLAFQGYNVHGSVLIRSSSSQAMSKILHYESRFNQKPLLLHASCREKSPACGGHLSLE